MAMDTDGHLLPQNNLEPATAERKLLRVVDAAGPRHDDKNDDENNADRRSWSCDSSLTKLSLIFASLSKNHNLSGMFRAYFFTSLRLRPQKE